MKLNLKNRKLFYTALISMIILSVVPLLFIYLLFTEKYHNYIVDNIFENQLNTIKVTSQLISNYFNELESSLFFVSSLYIQNSNRDFLLKNLQKHKKYIENFIVYKNNKLIFKSRDLSSKNRKIIYKMINKGTGEKIEYSDIFINLKTLTPYIFVKLRLQNADFILKANVNLIWNYLLKLKNKESQYIEILNKEYRLIASSEVEQIFNPKFILPDEIVNLVRNKFISGTTVIKINKKSYFLSFSYIDRLKWYVIMYQDQDEVLNSLYQIRKTSLLILFITILSIFLFLAFIFYKLNKRVKNFTNSLQDISFGNLDRKIERLHNDELGEIGKAINKMAAELKKNIHKIRDMELEKKKMEEINKLKSEFFSMITHDLKTPLAALSGTIDIFLRGTLGEITEEQKEFLLSAQKSIEELFDLINLILDIGKMENGNFNFTYTQFNIFILIDDLLKNLNPIFEKKRLKININYDKKFNGFIIADPTQIKRVLMNLLNNAVKFSPSDSSIDIEVLGFQDKCKISIKDYGKGIPESDIKKIFDKYYQSKNTVKGGTGLGLTLAKLVVDSHNGKIYAESELNKYTKFIIELPLNQNEKKN